jgi:hypothetical protein
MVSNYRTNLRQNKHLAKNHDHSVTVNQPLIDQYIFTILSF